MADTGWSVGNWLSAIGLALSTLVIAGGASLYVYATKGDLREADDKRVVNTMDIQVLKTHQAYQNSELQRVNTRLENIDVAQQAVSRNVERLLERFRVQVEVAPPPKPVPEASPMPRP